MDLGVHPRLFKKKNHGQGHGEYSIASLLTGKKQLPQLKCFMSQNKSYDIVVDDFKLEVKQVSKNRSDVRIGSNSYPVMSHINTKLLEIYNSLLEISQISSPHFIQNLNSFLSFKFDHPIDFKILILTAIDKIKNNNFSNKFLGLNTKEKINLHSLLIYINQFCNDCNIFKNDKSFILQISKSILGHFKLNREYASKITHDLYKKCACLSSKKLTDDDIKYIIKHERYLDKYQKIKSYITKKSVNLLLKDIDGIFFINSDNYNFVYIPRALFNNYIIFARVSQTVKIQLKDANLLK